MEANGGNEASAVVAVNPSEWLQWVRAVIPDLLGLWCPFVKPAFPDELAIMRLTCPIMAAAEFRSGR
jgi:hypothetical protein